MKIVVIIPTYNESENIGPLLDALSNEFKKIEQHECEILVVDDSSPDGTANIVREREKQYPFIHLLLRKEKAGLGAAYIHGFRYAMDKLGADVLIEMDADFQHDPSEVSNLIKQIDNGYDYVLGSRYTRGGGVAKDWGFSRKLMSFGGTWFSKIILGIFNVSDFTGGFKASRVKGFVDQINLDSILSKGFAYKLELLYRMHRLGAKITEIPIKFGIRFKGDSKMERDNFIDSMRVILTLRIRENDHLFKFLIVGTMGFITDIGLSNLFTLFIDKEALATSSASAIAIMVTFTLNNFWSFSDRKIGVVKKRLLGFILYVASSTVPIIFRYFFVDYVIGKMGYSFIVYNASIIFCAAVGLVWNFTVYSRIIWKDKK